MIAEIVTLADRRPAPNQGNGAREALYRVFRGEAPLEEIDMFLARLWTEGYAVLPFEPWDDEPDAAA